MANMEDMENIMDPTEVDVIVDGHSRKVKVADLPYELTTLGQHTFEIEGFKLRRMPPPFSVCAYVQTQDQALTATFNQYAMAHECANRMIVKISPTYLSRIFNNEIEISLDEALRLNPKKATFTIRFRLVKTKSTGLTKIGTYVKRIVITELASVVFVAPASAVPQHFLELVAPEQKSCPICAEAIENNGHLTPCYHLFHAQCVRPWISQHHTCPTCRMEIPAQ